MARRVELLDDRLVVRLTGWTRVGALSGDVQVPYGAIRGVSGRPFRFGPWTARIGGTSLGRINHGHFIHEKKRAFFSFEDPEQTVTLDLADPKETGLAFWTLVVGVDDPQSTADAIADRCGLAVDTPELVPAAEPEGRGDELSAADAPGAPPEERGAPRTEPRP